MRRLLCFQLLGTLSQVSSYCLQLDDQLLPSSLCIHQDSLTLNTYSKRTTPLERLALLIFPPLAHGHSMPAAAPSLINWSHFSRLISATMGVQGASPPAGSRGSALVGSFLFFCIFPAVSLCYNRVDLDVPLHNRLLQP